MAITNFTPPYPALTLPASWSVRGRLARFNTVDFNDNRTRYYRHRGVAYLTYDLVWYNLDYTEISGLINFWRANYPSQAITWTEPVTLTVHEGFIVSNLNYEVQADGSFDARMRVEVDYTAPSPLASNDLPLQPTAAIQGEFQHTVVADWSDNRKRYARKKGIPYAAWTLKFINRSLTDLQTMQQFWWTYYPGTLIEWNDPTLNTLWEGYIVADLEWEIQTKCQYDITLNLEARQIPDQEFGPGGGGGGSGEGET
jgi:hypothetical protein